MGETREIGKLHLTSHGYVVVCRECQYRHPANPGTPVFRVNICPYRQTCHVCRTMLVEGQTASWPELFEER